MIPGRACLEGLTTGSQFLRSRPYSGGLGGSMRRVADYTLGLVIVLVHLVLMSWSNEKLALGERRH